MLFSLLEKPRATPYSLKIEDQKHATDVKCDTVLPPLFLSARDVNDFNGPVSFVDASFKLISVIFASTVKYSNSCSSVARLRSHLNLQALYKI